MSPALAACRSVAAVFLVVVLLYGAAEEENAPPAAPARLLGGAKELAAIVKARNITKTLVTATGDDAFLRLIEEMAENFSKRSAWTMYRLALLEGVPNSLEVHRGVAETARFAGDSTNVEAVDAFLKDEELALFALVDEENFQAYMDHATKGVVWLCLAPSTLDTAPERVAEGIGTIARKYRGQMPFLWLDTNAFEEHARDELRCATYPTVVVQLGDFSKVELRDPETEKFRKALPADFTAADVGDFVEDVLAGKVEAIDEIADYPDEEKYAGVKEAEVGEQVKLPTGWTSETHTEHGKTYYYHAATKTAQWDRPVEKEQEL